jgi:hypothetical protein
MEKSQYIKDLQVMIEADAGHLAKALVQGDRTLAHGFVDAIINNRRELEDMERAMAQEQAAIGSV